MAEPGRGTDRRAECGHGLGRSGKAVAGQVGAGCRTGRSGRCWATCPPGSPWSLAQSSCPRSAASFPTLPCSLPQPQQQRGEGDLRPLESVGAQCTFAGSWTQGPSVSSCLVSAAPGQNPCFCPRVASCDTPAGPACPSHWWGTEARGGQTLTQSCTVSQGTLGTGSDVVS